MIEYYQVVIEFAALGASIAVLLFHVGHLNDVIRDLRLDLQGAEDECNRLEDRLKVGEVRVAELEKRLKRFEITDHKPTSTPGPWLVNRDDQ